MGFVWDAARLGKQLVCTLVVRPASVGDVWKEQHDAMTFRIQEDAREMGVRHATEV